MYSYYNNNYQRFQNNSKNRGRGGQKIDYSTYGDWKNYYYTNYASQNFPPKYQVLPNNIMMPINNEYYIQRQILFHVEKYIYSKYPDLMEINQQNTKLSERINPNCKFFIIKALTEEDIHKSIKYGVWCSNKNGNIILDNAFNITKENNGKVYLIFTCQGTDRYVGVAEMKNNYDEKRPFDLWTQDNVWIGLFDVKWLFIKDVPFKEFNNIFMTMKEGKIKPIFYAKDTQEVPYEVAKIIIEKIDKYLNSNTILEHFEYYDLRQESYEEGTKMNRNQNQSKTNDNIIKRHNETKEN